MRANVINGGTLFTAVIFLCVGPPVRLAAQQCPDGSPPPCPAATARPAPAPNTVAVLYFDNLSQDTADAYLADGLAEELIARLQQVGRLSVKSRTAVQRYRGRVEGPHTLGRDLGVSYVVNGSVRRSGSRVRVAVELVRTATGVATWGEQYDRSDADILTIQEDIAIAVTTAITGTLLAPERRALAKRSTRNPRAYDHYLRGNYAVAERTPNGVAQGILEYGAAVGLDPRFASAVARLAFAYGMFYEQRWSYGALSHDQVLARAVELADRAVQLDSTSSDAWMARGEVLSYAHPANLNRAIQAYQRAIALDPGNAQALHSYALMLQWQGDDAGAMAAYHRALAAEPARPVTLLNMARIRLAGRRTGESLRWLDSALSVDPGFFGAYALRARVFLALGRLAEARQDCEAAMRLAAGIPTMVYSALAVLEAKSGDTVRARRHLDQLLGSMADPERPTHNEGLDAAIALIALGDTMQAVTTLERTRPQDGLFWFNLRMPEFDGIRSHPRFQRLVEESLPR